MARADPTMLCAASLRSLAEPGALQLSDLLSGMAHEQAKHGFLQRAVTGSLAVEMPEVQRLRHFLGL